MTASKIEWTDRSDWNPIRGCTRVSPGCGGPGPHGGCYAEAIAARFSDPGQAFNSYAERTKSGPRWTGKVELQEDRLTLPLRWKKPARIFASSTSDIFHEALPDEAIDRIFAIMALAPQHTFQVLTKRAERMRDYMARHDVGARWAFAVKQLSGNMPAVEVALDWDHNGLPNVWLGVSVEDQQRADERIPLLLDTPAAKHFISAEPLLGPVDLTRYLTGREENGIVLGRPAGTCTGWTSPLDWVIAGGESGNGARPVHPEWLRALRDQCQADTVPFFLKQWGAWAPIRPDEHLPGRPRLVHAGDCFVAPDGRYEVLGPTLGSDLEDVGTPMRAFGKRIAGRLLDGRSWDEFPA